MGTDLWLHVKEGKFEKSGASAQGSPPPRPPRQLTVDGRRMATSRHDLSPVHLACVGAENRLAMPAQADDRLEPEPRLGCSCWGELELGGRPSAVPL